MFHFYQKIKALKKENQNDQKMFSVNFSKISKPYGLNAMVS